MVPSIPVRVVLVKSRDQSFMLHSDVHGPAPAVENTYREIHRADPETPSANYSAGSSGVREIDAGPVVAALLPPDYNPSWTDRRSEPPTQPASSSSDLPYTEPAGSGSLYPSSVRKDRVVEQGS